MNKIAAAAAMDRVENRSPAKRFMVGRDSANAQFGLGNLIDRCHTRRLKQRVPQFTHATGMMGLKGAKPVMFSQDWYAVRVKSRGEKSCAANFEVRGDRMFLAHVRDEAAVERPGEGDGGAAV
jgi:hypothetical protein